ncbi:hypothetical protein C5N99_00075 [Treponema medium]|uniref:Uncharacterized protein n=2 Tax=Treponema medium TaxID=58231 RepID=A0AA87NNV1_TREMD|nr:hypothetical protein [Treponema medium]EPF30002.1 hypothetical protein HMPREF9195_00013 [Treponema medium ATCC 700293]QSH91046.1 hypothetical protein C5N99_00075 [Treponema medium]QSH96182.1 hypothetical protein DWB79_00070 [Treponema medium]
MAVLLLLCIPLIFFSYAFQLEEKNKHIFLFFVGSAATTLFLLIVSFFSAKTDRYIGSLGSYFFYSFFVDTFIPFCIVLLIALIFSGFNVLPIPAALFGLFTVKIYQQLFLASTHLRIMPIVLCIILYASALFILDALLHFCTDITFYYTVACTLCFLLFIGILILGTFALGLHYFKGNPIIYGSILAGIALIGTVLHFILYRQGNAG